MATVQITITVPDALATDVLNTTTNELGYQTNILVAGELVPNPQTRKQFLDLKVRDYLKSYYVAGKVTANEPNVQQIRIDAGTVSMTV